MPNDFGDVVSMFPGGNQHAKRGALLIGTGVGWPVGEWVETADVGNVQAIGVVTLHAVGHGGIGEESAACHRCR